MNPTAKLTDDGRLVCQYCSDSELHYCQSFHRKNVFKARFDKESDRLFMIGKPLDNLSETLEIYEEYLLCSECKNRFDAPWDENGDREQEELKCEGDFLRIIKPEIPA